MLKDITGKASDELEFCGTAVSIGGVFDHYATLYPRIREMASSIVLARNQEFARAAAQVEEGDEIAFLPPVSGGAGGLTHEIEDKEGHFFALTRERIDTSALVSRLLRGEDGAVVNFEGVVRNNTKGRRTLYLDYECYEAMAIKTLALIGREIASAHAIGRIAMVHRLGRMHIGEASVAVIAAAPHRRPAFEAALEGINRLKRVVPIWKKEYFEDGEVWVEGEWDDNALVAHRA